MALEYITTREIANKEGEVKGKIKIMKLKEDADAMLEITCPNCGKSDKRKEAWTEPFTTGEKKNRKFLVSCNGCGFKAKLLNLQKQAKKDQKANKK